MYVAIIDGGGANFLSVSEALCRYGIDSIVTNDHRQIVMANAVILPGVGNAHYAMSKLIQYDLVDLIAKLRQPFLGICLGMQLLYEYSEEDSTRCLGIISGEIKKLSSDVVVPHMGWNNIEVLAKDIIVSDMPDNSDVYFVHSYFAPVNKATIATCDYGCKFSAIAKYKNFYAMQFHPEKSGKIGAILLRNFLQIAEFIPK